MKRLGLTLWLLFLPLFWLPYSQAQESKPLSAELLWQLDRIGSPKISPQGDHIIAPVTRFDVTTDKSQTQLWLFSADGKVQRPLTAEGLRVSEATFSPKGDAIAFISQRGQDSTGQVYLLPIHQAGEATRLTQVPTGVHGIKWVGEHIYFISKVWPGKDWAEMSEQIKANAASHVSAHQWNALPYAQFDHWLDESREAHVFRIPAKGGDIEAVTQAFQIQLPRSSQSASSYDVDSKERWIAFVADSLNNGVSPDNDIFLAELGKTTARNITSDNRGNDSAPLFSPNGETLAFQRQLITGFYADQSNLILYDLKKQTSKSITEGWDRSVGGLVWTADSRGFYASIDDAGTSRVYHLDARNGKIKAITAETNFSGLSISNNNILVASNESFMHPAQLVNINTRTGKATRLDSFNNEVLAQVELGSYESVTYKGHNGQDIQMWVHYPPGFDKSKKYPLFLLIHGGPHSAISNGFHFRWNAQTFASWGYVTAWHNFHGSSGFGQDFTDAINPDWVTAPYADTIAAADWFKNKEWIDSERMVAGGGSYGGYLSSILLGKEHPFKALLIHAPVYNMYSQMSADFAVHAERFGHYWDNPSIYREISPHYYAGNFNTPALIIHGQKDLRVPVGQGFELFRTLQSRGVDSRLIYYPDENHWVLKPNNSIYWYNEVRRWMESYAPPGAQ